MSDRPRIALAGIALVPIACCLGLPLLAAASLSVGLGLGAGGLGLIATAALLTRKAMSKRTP